MTQYRNSFSGLQKFLSTYTVALISLLLGYKHTVFNNVKLTKIIAEMNIYGKFFNKLPPRERRTSCVLVQERMIQQSTGYGVRSR